MEIMESTKEALEQMKTLKNITKRMSWKRHLKLNKPKMPSSRPASIIYTRKASMVSIITTETSMKYSNLTTVYAMTTWSKYCHFPWITFLVMRPRQHLQRMQHTIHMIILTTLLKLMDWTIHTFAWFIQMESITWLWYIVHAAAKKTLMQI